MKHIIIIFFIVVGSALMGLYIMTNIPMEGLDADIMQHFRIEQFFRVFGATCFGAFSIYWLLWGTIQDIKGN